MARPGIMLYFETLRAIKVLPLEDIGRLTLAMLEYGEEGINPEFDGMLALAWGFIKPKLDKDEEEYNLSVLRRQYATTCRERKKKGEPDISFDDWLKNEQQGDHQRSSMMTNDNQWYPTTTTSTTTKTTTSTTTAAAATATTNTNDEDDGDSGEESKVVRAVGGTLGKGVVFMSDEQVADLLDRMGIEAFDHYVDKLSDFIIKNGARVKSHYETILKWWKEDSSLR